MNKKEYKIINGTSYDVRTPDAIIDTLEKARLGSKRVRITYKEGFEDFTGYTKDGLNVTMLIGRSTGIIKIPLHIKTKRSYGGSSLSDCGIEKVVIL